MTDPLRIVLLSWRDSGHLEGGGSELYSQTMAAGLAAQGHTVTMLTARYPGSTKQAAVDGYRIVRSGGRFSVYLWALARLLLRRVGCVGRVDVVVDVQNGTPFFARLVTRKPVVVLCHHVHREQWGIAFGGSRTGRVLAHLGWWVESRLAPWVQRGCRYVTVSEVSRRDLIALGVRPANITIVHNGTPPAMPGAVRSGVPEIVVLGRLVPHKRVEHAVRAVHALAEQLPELRLTVIGQGWWSEHLREEVVRLGLEGRVELAGHVEEVRKHELLGRAWVLAVPSVMEGWGLCVVEAATHGTPAVAYRSAGGIAESIVDGVTGLLTEDDEQAFTQALRELLGDQQLRAQMGAAAREHAKLFTHDASVRAFATVLLRATGRVARTDLRLPQPRPTVDADQLV